MGSGGQVDPEKRKLGGLLISSTQGHSGKTVVSLGLCRLLKKKGLSVQPFKKGPDYIDPSWLMAAAGRSCRNLDLFLIPEEKLAHSFYQSCRDADLALVEGNMGLYDGIDASGTTAGIARLFRLPVLLVVNATRMTGSIAAMVSGYQHFQKDILIAGVILNYVSGSRHERKLKEAVEGYCGIPVLGSLPRDPDLLISERHLGLIPSIESEKTEEIIERIASGLAPHLDLDRILMLAWNFQPHHPIPRSIFPFPHPSPLPVFSFPRPLGERDRVRGRSTFKIGIIRDRAFHFYYPENLEALSREGGELIEINAFRDRLPEIDGLYIGGGFPEFFLEELEGNKALRMDIARAIERGLPVYAECAGLLYLCRSIAWKGRSHEMVGAIPSRVELSVRPEGHGYVVAEVIGENPFFPTGLTFRGHEFHHSSLLDPEGLPYCYRMKRGQGVKGNRDGIVYKNLFASYVHLHALGTPEWAEGFLSLIRREKDSRKGPRLNGKSE